MNFKIVIILALTLLPQVALADTVLSILNARNEVIKTYSMEQLDGLGQTSYATENAFIDGRSEFSGPSVRVVMADAGLEIGPGDSYEMIAVNDYAVTVPAEDILDYDVILATRRDGERMSLREKGPIWLMYPISDHDELQDAIYNSRLIWQLTEVRAIQ